MTKGKERTNLLGIIPAITHIDTLGVFLIENLAAVGALHAGISIHITGSMGW